jgi:hypothetical protein
MRFARFGEWLEVVGERHDDALLVGWFQVAGFHVMWVFGVIGIVVLGIVVKTMFRSKRWQSKLGGGDYGRDVQMWCVVRRSGGESMLSVECISKGVAISNCSAERGFRVECSLVVSRLMMEKRNKEKGSDVPLLEGIPTSKATGPLASP